MEMIISEWNGFLNEKKKDVRQDVIHDVIYQELIG